MRKCLNVAMVCALVLAISAPVALVGCSGGGQQSSSSSESSQQSSSATETSGTHTVVDAMGNSVEIPDDVKSVVVPFPAAAQTVLGLGASDLLTGGMILDTDMNQKMFASAMSKITSIRPGDINAEVVMNCNPDFVVLASAKQAEALADVNVPVLMFSAASIADLEKDCTMIAEAIDTDEAKEKAAAYTNFYEKLKNEVVGMTASIPEAEKPVVYLASDDDPLVSIGAGSVANDWVDVSGGKYVPEILGMNEFDINLTAEQLIDANPDIIICTTVAGRDAIMSNPAYANISAVQSGKVYLNPMGGSVWFKAHFEAPLELAWAPTVIAPAQTANLDTRAYVDEFYQTFYGYNVTDADYELIMNPTAGSK